MKEWLKLGHVFNMEQWENLQKSLAQVTGMAIITVDYKGIPVTEHSCCQEFCKKIRKDPILGQYCEKCDSRGGLEAVRLSKPYIYQCCFSIIDVAIPIIVDNTYLGAVMAGQVRLPANQNTEIIEKIYVPINDRIIDQKREELRREYNEIPLLQYEQIQIIAMMLFYLCNYMVKEADNKRQVIEMYEAVFQKHEDLLTDSKEENHPINSVKRMNKSMSDLSATSAVQKEYLQKINSSNSIILKVVDYIYNHKGETVSLKTVADYCHVSSSYLSRLFTKEVGVNYSSFTTKLKVDLGKEILETTEFAISRISEELGFNDVGYFIKIFKKHVGVTPAFYRTYCKR